jgi:hypothetical protein
MMPNKNPNTERFGGPGSSKQDRQHPEKGGKQHDAPLPVRRPAGENRKCLAASATSTTRTMIGIGADELGQHTTAV